MAPLILLLALVAVAVVTDVTRQKIYNWNVYPGIILGFIVNGTLGSGLKDSLEGFLACGLIMLFCFLFFDLGGGDVKLITMMGTFLGLGQGIEAMLWTFVLGGIGGVIILIWRIGVLRLLSRSFHHVLLILRAKSWVPLTDKERQPLKKWLTLAPEAFAAICIVSSGLFK